MKVTKYTHSCLLVEQDDKRILIDPGVFSWDTHQAELGALNGINHILVTHMHPDHCHLPFLQQLLLNSPAATVHATEDTARMLYDEAKVKVTEMLPDEVKATVANHAELWGGVRVPLNAQFTVFERLTHVGDTHEFTESAEILALPVYAPWGSFKNALLQAVEVKPQQVLPIHDWFWSEAGRDWHYQRATEGLSGHGIEFVDLKPAIAIEL